MLNSQSGTDSSKNYYGSFPPIAAFRLPIWENQQYAILLVIGILAHPLKAQQMKCRLV